MEATKLASASVPPILARSHRKTVGKNNSAVTINRLRLEVCKESGFDRIMSTGLACDEWDSRHTIVA
jgi:hypothetical protein